MSPALSQLAAPRSEEDVLSLYRFLSMLCPPGTGTGFGCGWSPRCWRVSVQVQTAVVSPVPSARDPPRPLPSLLATRAHRGSEPSAAPSPGCDTAREGSASFQGGPATTPKSTNKPWSLAVPAPRRGGGGQGRVLPRPGGSGHKRHFHHTRLDAVAAGTGSGFAAIIAFAAKDRQCVTVRSGMGEPTMARSRRT